MPIKARGSSRRPAIALLIWVAAVAIAGCGSRGQAPGAENEKASDVAILNTALGQELTTADAYARGRVFLRGPARAVGRRLQAQEEEYIDALTKAIRGLGGKTEAVVEPVDLSSLHGQRAFLELAYGLEGRALASYLDAAARLYTTAPRSLDASLAAAHAQHLVLLRRSLGADPVASVPKAFDSGELPPPGAAAAAGRE